MLFIMNIPYTLYINDINGAEIYIVVGRGCCWKTVKYYIITFFPLLIKYRLGCSSFRLIILICGAIKLC